jgi:AcrR family transcriptional regulator
MARRAGGRPRLQDTTVERRRARAVQLALDMFLASGWQGVTLKAVSNGLGYSTAAIYRLFPNKTALMVEAIQISWPLIQSATQAQFGVLFPDPLTLVSFLEFHNHGQAAGRNHSAD